MEEKYNYIYFVTYRTKEFFRRKIGSATVTLDHRVKSLEDVEEMESLIEKRLKYENRILRCKKLIVIGYQLMDIVENNIEEK